MHQQFQVLYQQFLALWKQFLTLCKQFFVLFKQFLSLCKQLLSLYTHTFLIHMRFLRAIAVSVFLLCLCLSGFLGHNTNAVASDGQNTSQDVTDAENLPTIEKNPNIQTALPLDTSTEEATEIVPGLEDSTNVSGNLENAGNENSIPESSIGIRYVSGTCVNLRSKPSLESDVLNKLYRNTQLELLATNDGDFYRVRYNGVVGYMHKDYLSETEIKIEAPPKVDYSYIGDFQERVATIAKNNQGTQPCINGFCAKWVSGIYEAAGLGYPGGNAIDYWTSWGYSGSTSMDNIPVGAVVVGSGSGSEAGNKYGHVGIYIGDGMVADNIGYHRIISIWDWATANDGYCQGYHGYIGWVWPYGQPLGN